MQTAEVQVDSPPQQSPKSWVQRLESPMADGRQADRPRGCCRRPERLAPVVLKDSDDRDNGQAEVVAIFDGGFDNKRPASAVGTSLGTTNRVLAARLNGPRFPSRIEQCRPCSLSRLPWLAGRERERRSRQQSRSTQYGSMACPEKQCPGARSLI